VQQGALLACGGFNAYIYNVATDNEMMVATTIFAFKSTG